MAVNISSIARNIVNFNPDHVPGFSDVAGPISRLYGEVVGCVTEVL